MAYNIPRVRYDRVAAMFMMNEGALITKPRSFESSGSDHSANLSGLVNSFFEREIREQRGNVVDDDLVFNESADEDEAERIDEELALHDALTRLLDGSNADVVRSNIQAEVQNLLEELGGAYLPDFKRRLMARLQNGGFDAGLCKSKWEKNGRLNVAGEYEYIDIISGGTRYIVEVSLAGHFTIARPTESYTTLIEKLPPVYVGKPDELKKLVSLMCSAIKKSMKRVSMHVAPWRRLRYMQAKWFAPYKRTGNEISTRRGMCIAGVGTRRVGFSPVLGASSSFFCREDGVANGTGVSTGNLGFEASRDLMA